MLSFLPKNPIKNRVEFFTIKMGEKDSEVWELDFFSRPITDESGKKIWELIVTDDKQTFDHIETIPNNLINSKELKKRIKRIIEYRGKPNMIKFFRAQMSNMISIALGDFDIKIKPSRRTFALFEKIKEREKTVYPKMKNYNHFMKDVQQKLILKILPEKIPDKLKGDVYTFALIEKNKIEDILKEHQNKKCFQSFPFTSYLEKKIPGIVIYSSRAKSLANWLDSIEICNLTCDVKEKNILIECGLSTQYIFSTFTEQQSKEASYFEKIKITSGGIHFLSVQDVLDKQTIFGFWLLNSQP